MKFIRNFKTVEEANTAGQNGMNSPHMDYIKDTETNNFFETIEGGVNLLAVLMIMGI